jgi:DNA-binding HxlR family transcriptional regulator
VSAVDECAIFDGMGEGTQDPLESCPALAAGFALLGKRWTALILDVVSSRPARFCEIQRAIPGLSDRLLAERLRELTASGLVEREPPEGRVGVYELTALGSRLLPALNEIRGWARQLEGAAASG